MTERRLSPRSEGESAANPMTTLAEEVVATRAEIVALHEAIKGGSGGGFNVSGTWRWLLGLAFAVLTTIASASLGFAIHASNEQATTTEAIRGLRDRLTNVSDKLDRHLENGREP